MRCALTTLLLVGCVLAPQAAMAQPATTLHVAARGLRPDTGAGGIALTADVVALTARGPRSVGLSLARLDGRSWVAGRGRATLLLAPAGSGGVSGEVGALVTDGHAGVAGKAGVWGERSLGVAGLRAGMELHVLHVPGSTAVLAQPEVRWYLGRGVSATGRGGRTFFATNRTEYGLGSVSWQGSVMRLQVGALGGRVQLAPLEISPLPVTRAPVRWGVFAGLGMDLGGRGYTLAVDRQDRGGVVWNEVSLAMRLPLR